MAAKPIPPFYTKLAMVLISLLAVFYIAILGREILAPMIFSLLFAFLLLPLAGFFEKELRFPRSLSSIFSVLALLLFVAALFYLIGSQVSLLAKDWPSFKQQLGSSVNELQQWISNKFHVNLEDQKDYVDNAASRILNTGPSVIGSTIVSVSSVLLFIVFMMVDTFFLLYYRRLIIRFLVAVFKEENSVAVYDIIA
ncbi:MAG: AI-2E family transporter, partial [Bacteroidota bacterium]|nr:AI-2E family transporter [Bacteroidota bacterium]